MTLEKKSNLQEYKSEFWVYRCFFSELREKKDFDIKTRNIVSFF